MTRVLLAALVALLLELATQVASAGTITVGTANTGNCAPFMCNTDQASNSGVSVHYQQVYSASAFSGPVTISSETFYWMFAQRFGGTDKLLGGTYLFSLSTTTAGVNGLNGSCLTCNIGADNTQVLLFTVPAGGILFGTSFTFNNTTDFTYNPSAGNVLLDIQVSDQDLAPNGSGNSFNDADDTGSVTSQAIAFFSGSNSGGSSGIGLVTTFNVSELNVPEPNSLLLMAGGLLGLAFLRRRRSA